MRYPYQQSEAGCRSLIKLSQPKSVSKPGSVLDRLDPNLLSAYAEARRWSALAPGVGCLRTRPGMASSSRNMAAECLIGCTRLCGELIHRVGTSTMR
jgi:hypothetical protein